jgi:hypothetical protein
MDKGEIVVESGLDSTDLGYASMVDFVNSAVKMSVPYNAEDFLTRCPTINLLRMTPLLRARFHFSVSDVTWLLNSYS